MRKEVRIVVTCVGEKDWKRTWASFHLSADPAGVLLVTFAELCVVWL